MMTKTHFEAIAEVLRYRKLKSEAGAQEELIHLIAEDLSRYFKTVNQSFDKSKFMRKAGWYNE